MSTSPVPLGALNQIAGIAEALIAAAEATARATKKLNYHRRRSRYRQLRPGTDTPLWDELASSAAKLLRRRGDKAQLARVLGVPRQRIHKLLVEKSASPDAERTLLLLCWVNARQRGETLC